MNLPGSSLARRASFYESLATSIGAGLPMTAVLELAGKRDDRYGEWARRAAHGVARGRPFADSLDRAASLPPLERAAITSGERSGCLAEVLARLADDLRGRATARRRVVLGQLYPVALVHAAILLPQLRIWVADGLPAYLLAVVPPLAGLYVAGFVALTLLRAARRSPRTAAALDRLLLRLPLVGSWIKSAAGAAWAGTASLLLGVGMPLPETLKRAAEGVRNVPIREALASVPRTIELGGNLEAGLVPAQGLIPDDLFQAVVAGEASGRLEELLANTANRLRDAAGVQRDLFIRVLAGAVFLAVALYVAAVVIGSYLSIYSQIP